jgi:hypothetical protein
VVTTSPKPALATVYNAMKPFAKELQGYKLTDELRIHKRGSMESKAAGVALKEKMRVAAQKALAEDSTLVAAVDSMWARICAVMIAD